MTVLHRGLLWPTYNPGRFWTRYDGRLTMPPTALRWEVGGWGGIIGAGAPTGGSDLLPVYPSPLPALRYQKQLFGVLGNTFFLRVDVSIIQAPAPAWDRLSVHVQVVQGGAQQLVGPAFLVGYDWAWQQLYGTGSNLAPIPDAVAFPNFYFTFSPVNWTASPPPPTSTPF